MSDTNLSDTLAALSEAATQGEWELQEPMDHELWIVEAGKQCYEWRVIAGTPWPDQRGDIPRKQVEANAAFIVALVNAYRTGQLVPVPSVERVATSIANALFGPKFDPFVNPEAFDQCKTIATAVITAMQKPKP